MAICMLAVFCASGVQAQAKTKSKNPARVTLKVGKTYTKYDLTGDGKADKIKITGKKSDDIYEKVAVSVNGKKTVFRGDWMVWKVKLQILTLKNGKCYLWVKGYGDDGDDPWEALYQYKKGKLVKSVDFKTYTNRYAFHSSTDVIGISGNTITVKHDIMSSPLANMQCVYKYSYKKGALRRTSATGKITMVGYDYEKTGKSGTLRRKRTLYSTAMGKKKVTVLPAGTKAKAIRIYMDKKNIRVQLKASNGKTGWVRCSKKFEDKSLLFQESFYAG